MGGWYTPAVRSLSIAIEGERLFEILDGERDTQLRHLTHPGI
jgi:hypothetical protein